MTLSSPKIGTKFLLTSYYNNLLGAGHYLSRGEREKKKGGSRLFHIGWRRGGGLNFFIKMFSGVSSLNARYISKGVHWPRWVKHLNSRVQIIYVKQ